jgi:formylglycine-generating enzyme required for sulfatase activity
MKQLKISRIPIVVILLFLTACGSDSKKDVNVIFVNDMATITLKQSEVFNVTATNTDFTVSTIPITGAGCAKSGNAVTCTPTASGTYVITITATADTSKTDKATLTVNDITIAIVSEPPATVTVGAGSAVFEVSTADFTYSVSNEEKAGCVKEGNKVTCTPIAAGAYDLVFVAVADNEKKASGTFTAVEPAPEEEVTVSGIIMRYVEHGSFSMGCDPDEDHCDTYAQPKHNATLTKDYYLGKHEVSQKQWYDVMENNPSPEPTSENLPVAGASYTDILEFIAKLNAQNAQPEGWEWRLPTETQWEYAALGGSKPKNCEGGCLYSGSNIPAEVSWYGDGGNSDGKSQPVGQLKPNELGLYDMSGNVGEIVADLFNSYDSEPRIDYIGPATDNRGRDGSDPSKPERRVVRGGNYTNLFLSTNVKQRSFNASNGIPGSVGFRLALVPIETSEATSTAEPTFFESASATVSGVWDSAVSGIKSLWNSITK